MLRATGFDDVIVEGDILSMSLNGQVTVPDLVRRLVENGAAINAVTPEERSLEDVYLRLLEDPQ